MPDHEGNVVYCPVAPELAEKMRGEGLTTRGPVRMMLVGESNEIVVTELRPDHIATPVDWRQVADVLAEELARWGWGDFHYGPQPQEESVVKALQVYETAVAKS